MTYRPTWVTKLYLKIKNLKTPEWLRGIFDKIVRIVFGVLREFTEEQILFLRAEIARQAKKDIPGAEKLKNVIDKFNEQFKEATQSKSLLNFAIEYILQELKYDKFID